MIFHPYFGITFYLEPINGKKRTEKETREKVDISRNYLNQVNELWQESFLFMTKLWTQLKVLPVFFEKLNIVRNLMISGSVANKKKKSQRFSSVYFKQLMGIPA